MLLEWFCLNNNIYACIEIGSFEIRMMVCNIREERFYVLSHKSIESVGVERGYITNFEKLVGQIKKLKKIVETDLKQPIKQVLLTVPAIDAGIENVSNKIDLDVNKQINSADVRKLFRNVINHTVDESHIAVNIIPRMFRIDESNVVQNPRGITGINLRIDAQKVLAPVTVVSNLVHAVETAGFRIADIFMGSISEALYALNVHGLSQRVCHINIGHSMTTVTVLNEGKIAFSQSLSVGGKDITKAIADAFSIDEDIADRLKIDFGKVDHDIDSVDEQVVYVADSKNNLNYITRRMLCAVVTEQCDIIFQVVRNHLNERAYGVKDEIHYALSGGTAEMSGIMEMFNRYLGDDYSLHRPSMLGIRDAKWCNLAGMAIFAHEISLLIGQKKSSIDMEFYNKTKPDNEKKPSVVEPQVVPDTVSFEKPVESSNSSPRVFGDDLQIDDGEDKEVKQNDYMDHKLENSGVLVRLFDMIFNENSNSEQ